MNVRALAYLGLEATDLAEWRGYATGILGLMNVPSEDGTLRFRMDSRSWRIAIEQGERDDISFLGFEVTDPQSLRDVRQQAEEAGVATFPGDPALIARRRVIDLFYFSDPSGIQVEVCYGATEVFEEPFRSPAGVTGFVTGDQGLGHVVLLAPDAHAAMEFYHRTLGLRLTDVINMQIPIGNLEVLFMNCNPRHHSLAVACMPSNRRLDHFMLEVTSIDDMGLAYDRSLKAGVPIRMSIGRHSNDHMLSFYGVAPGGVSVEYGWGPRVLGTDWQVVRYDTGSVWGHHHAPSPVEARTPVPAGAHAGDHAG